MKENNYTLIMKLEAKVFLKDNQLYNVSDSSLLDENKVVEFEVEQGVVEIEEDIYNEELLAALRDEMKALDAENRYAWIKIVSDSDLSSDLEAFTNTFNHTARRVKDCECVIGFILSENLLAMGMEAVESFCEVIAKKHAQYIHMAPKSLAEKYNLTEALTGAGILVK